MGRKRVGPDPYHPLPKGLYRHRAKFRTRDAGNHWISFDGPQEHAIEAYHAWRARNTPTELRTIEWLMDQFTLIECPALVKAGKIKPRTAKDYVDDAEAIKVGVGKFRIERLMPKHIYEFRDILSESQPKHVRNVLAALSRALTFAVQRGYRNDNPCKQVQRPKHQRRLRLISHEEYLNVYAHAKPSVQLAMLLAVRTLALPGDILQMGADNIAQVGDQRVLRFRRNKTGALITIAIEGELADAIDKCLEDSWVKFRKTPFVHTRERKGQRGTDPSRYPPHPYTVDGLRAMFQGYCEKAGITDFGLRDLRAKGATDMYLAGVDIRQIQMLLGHSTEQTTRIYIKSYLGIVVRPNMVPIIAETK
jgi:integrase